jgi:hypothetical protein
MDGKPRNLVKWKGKRSDAAWVVWYERFLRNVLFNDHLYTLDAFNVESIARQSSKDIVDVSCDRAISGIRDTLSAESSQFEVQYT